jgi:metal-responsive CopG/Arc/MetJ family transcriptional regulator
LDGRQAATVKIKLNEDLWAKVKKVAMAAGYSSPEEFVEHVLEREIAKLEDTQTDQEVVDRLKGLGYID